MEGMLTLLIPGPPTPWSAPMFSKFKVYDKRCREKDDARRSLRTQYQAGLITYPVKIKFQFYMPIPKSTSRAAKEAMIHNMIPHVKKPDLSNLVKFAEDMLKGIVLIDDNLVTKIIAMKCYSIEPKTVMTISPYGG